VPTVVASGRALRKVDTNVTLVAGYGHTLQTIANTYNSPETIQRTYLDLSTRPQLKRVWSVVNKLLPPALNQAPDLAAWEARILLAVCVAEAGFDKTGGSLLEGDCAAHAEDTSAPADAHSECACGQKSE